MPCSHKFQSLKQRLRAAGWLTRTQLTAQLGISRTTIGQWRAEGRLKGRICNDLVEWLYRPPEAPLLNNKDLHEAAVISDNYLCQQE